MEQRASADGPTSSVQSFTHVLSLFVQEAKAEASAAFVDPASTDTRCNCVKFRS